MQGCEHARVHVLIIEIIFLIDKRDAWVYQIHKLREPSDII
jgi:hypothetical protein